jgi:hypothetical protein
MIFATKLNSFSLLTLLKVFFEYSLKTYEEIYGDKQW